MSSELKPIIVAVVTAALSAVVLKLLDKDPILVTLGIVVCGAIWAAMADRNRLRSTLAVAITVLLIAVGAGTGYGVFKYTSNSKNVEARKGPATPFKLSIDKAERLSSSSNTYELEVTGKVSRLGPGETIWVANLPVRVATAQHVTPDELHDATVWPAFGPCRIIKDTWNCDRVYVAPNEDHYILAYRADSVAARFFVQYQVNGFASGLDACKKNRKKCQANFPPKQLPQGAQLVGFITKRV